MTSTSSSTELQLVVAVDAAVTAHAVTVLGRALTADERDDRFDAWPTDDASTPRSDGPESFVAVLATSDGEPVGYLGGSPGGDRLQLDALIDPDVDDRAGLFLRMLDHLVSNVGRGHPGSPGTSIEVWAKPSRPWHEEAARSLGMEEHRALHQMRCPLPTDADAVPTRPFVLDTDLDALRSVNNRAFAAHPDQGAQTTESLLATMAEPWFRPEGVRMFEQEGRIAGFCWTKIHRSPPAPVELGEIYVIGVDPDFHGRGFGVPMTAAGLVWLADQGIETGMLYVEADNVPAIKTYERLNFSVLRTDRAWTWAVPEGARRAEAGQEERR